MKESGDEKALQMAAGPIIPCVECRMYCGPGKRCCNGQCVSDAFVGDCYLGPKGESLSLICMSFCMQVCVYSILCECVCLCLCVCR